MLYSTCAVVLWAELVLALPASGGDPTPADQLKSMKAEGDVILRDLNRSNVPGTEDAVRKRGADRYRQRSADLVRRALALAEAHPDLSVAPEALSWAFVWLLGGYAGERYGECDAICDAVSARYVDRAEILPMINSIWVDAGWAPRVEPFLTTVLDKSRNDTVKGAACFSLAKVYERLASAHRILADPVRGEPGRRKYGPENLRRVLALDPAKLKQQATALLERTIKEYAAQQPFGKARPSLGEQAQGALFRIKNLELGCTIPDIDGKDLDGKPLKLSEYRGKVVLVAFWAGWCGPCMSMVPIEKSLVERMSGRPFVMVGVNGDENQAEAKSLELKKAINWRSVWDGGSRGTTASKWGVQSWPTSYLVDANGVIRHANLRGQDLDKAVEDLVAQTERAAR